jgi:hypothetical protein
MIALLESEQFELPFMRTTHPVKTEGHDQNARILAHLQAGRTITALEALEWFKCFRLASRVCDLRKAGYDVQKRTIKTNSGKSIAEYYLCMQSSFSKRTRDRHVRLESVSQNDQ